MAGEGKNRWIVLLDKSPRGPLTAEEIQALLDKGIVRRNDIAYQLPDSPDSKATTEWKLLWQFADFDRRSEPKNVANAAPMERRVQEPTEITRSPLAELPEDLLNISPEDLLPK